MIHRLLALALPLVLLACGNPALGQEHETDPDAMKAFVQLVESYRARPGFTVKSHAKIEMSQGAVTGNASEVDAEITRLKGHGGIVKLNGFTCYLRDGLLIAVHEDTDHSYYKTDDEGSPYYALMNTFVDIPYPHLAIAFGEDDVEQWLAMQLHPAAPYVRPTSVADETAEDGRAMRRLKLTSDYATMEIVIDAAEQLIETLDLRITGGNYVQAGTMMSYHYDFEHEVLDASKVDARVLDFDPVDRQRVDMLATLRPPQQPAGPPGGGPGGGVIEQPRGGLVGKAAPGILLATLDGDAIDLEELRGKVVVLDFFATWCPPCRKALPELHEVARWAKGKGLPVKIVVVNVYEKGDADTRLAKVKAFWEKNRYSLAVAMDYTDEVGAAYGVSGIPATFIVRSDGVVHAQHTGAPPNYGDQLKADIQGALAVLEDDVN